MAEAVHENIYDAVVPNLDHIITEDDESVDNMFSAKQQRLLVEPLYTSWKPGRPFLADANVGIFNSVYQPPIVPDMFLSLDVEPDKDIWKKEKAMVVPLQKRLVKNRNREFDRYCNGFNW